MKIDRVIVSANDEEQYQSYWPYFAEICVMFGLHPTLLWVTTDTSQPFPFPSTYGEVIPLSTLSRFDTTYQSKIVRSLGMAGLPGVNTICDIDLFITSPGYRRTLEQYDLETTLAVWSGDDPNQFLYQTQRKYVDGYMPAISMFGFSGSNKLVQKIFHSNNIEVKDHNFWGEWLVEPLLNLPRTHIMYPTVYEFKGSDQRWISQLAHHHVLESKAPVNFQKIESKDPAKRSYSFGDSAIYWPSGKDMEGIRNQIEESAIVPEEMITDYVGVHWYRDPTKISTRLIAEAILAQKERIV